MASPKAFKAIDNDTVSNLPSKSKSPAPVPSRRQSTAGDVSRNTSPASHCRPVLKMDVLREQPSKELPEIRDIQKEGHSSRLVTSFVSCCCSSLLNCSDKSGHMFAVQASLRGKGYGKKNLTKNLRWKEASITFAF